MFYCDECAVKNDYPITIGKSMGNCELCDCGWTSCNDMPSSSLPSPIDMFDRAKPPHGIDDLSDPDLIDIPPGTLAHTKKAKRFLQENAVIEKLYLMHIKFLLL